MANNCNRLLPFRMTVICNGTSVQIPSPAVYKSELPSEGRLVASFKTIQIKHCRIQFAMWFYNVHWAGWKSHTRALNALQVEFAKMVVLCQFLDFGPMIFIHDLKYAWHKRRVLDFNIWVKTRLPMLDNARRVTKVHSVLNARLDFFATVFDAILVTQMRPSVNFN